MFTLAANTKIYVSTSVYIFMMNEDQFSQKCASSTTTEFVGCLSEEGKLFSDFILD